MAKEAFFLSREALYIKVWETPTVKLAKEFGVSDVAIGKMCKRLDVPKPPLGYWRRVETGAKKKIPPLTKPNDKTKAGVWIYPKSEEQTLEFEDEYKKQSAVIEQNIAKQSGLESLPENKIEVAATLHKPHQLVAQTRDILAKGMVDSYGAVHGKWGEEHLNLRISKKNLNRSLRIMDALLKALDKRGCKTTISLDQQLKTEVQVEEIKIEIALREDFKRFERELSAEEKKSTYVSDRYYFEPSGTFTFSINNSFHTQQNWRDGKTALVEDQLNDIVVGIFRAAESLRQKEIERKNEERKQLEVSLEREKHKILQKRQVDCRELFTELLAKWQKSQDIENFLASYKAKIIEEKGEITPGSDEELLIEWASDYAEKLNPVKSNRISEVVNKIKHLKDDPVEEDSYEISNLLWKLKH